MLKRRVYFGVVGLGVALSVNAWAFSPFMGDYENQIAVYGSLGVNSGFIVPPPCQMVPFYFLHLQYSQPTTFFRIPARKSINVGQTIGIGRRYGWNWEQYSIPMGFLSEDIVLLYGARWYLGAGAGVGLQVHQNERLGAKLLFQFKLAAAFRFTECTAAEVFVQHFSNANTAEQNNSYGFYGLGFLYNF